MNAEMKPEWKKQIKGDGKKRFDVGPLLTKQKSTFQQSRLGLVQLHKQHNGLGVVDTNQDKAKSKQSKEDESEMMFMQQQQSMYKDLMEMPYEQQKSSHINVLLVMDDVVGAIKKAEFDPRLAQLVMNRRHLIFNGTLSIIVVS